MSINLRYIRDGIISALGTSTPVYNKMVPKSLDPKTYILITNQFLQEYEIAKGCYEWSSQFTLELVTKTTINGDATEIIDDLQEVIEPKIRNLTIQRYLVKNISLVNSIDNDFNTNTNTINRRLITYDIWLRGN